MHDESPDALELLADALSARCFLNKERTRNREVMAFQRKITLALMEQVRRDFPDAIALGDGVSILARCAQADAVAAAQWRDLRGPQAWAPTPATPYPLSAAMNPAGTDRYETLRMSKREDLERFVADGMDHAMPLSQTQALQWTPGAITREQRSQLEAQAEVLQAINSSHTDAMRQAQVKLLVEAGGAMPHEATMALHGNEAMVLSGLLSPKTPLIGMADPDTGGWMPWWKEWVKRGDYAGGMAMVKVLKQHGIDTAAVEKKIALQRASGVVDGITGGSSATTVHEQLRAIDQLLPKGSFLENRGVLVWHRAVTKLPALLSVLVEHDDPNHAVLGASSSTGQGIWDAVGNAMIEGKRISGAAAAALKKRVKVEMSEGGFVWKQTPVSTQQGTDGLMKLGADTPHLLLGDTKTQQRETGLFFEQILDASMAEDWRVNKRLQVLYDPQIPVDALCPETRATLHVVRDFLLGHPRANKFLKDVPQLRNELPYDMPAKVDARWAKKVQLILNRPGDDPAENKQRSLLLALMQHSLLAGDTKHIPVATPARRAGRRL